ncbi:MAG TPA: hypothetical protein VNO30_32675 [Kofleriaceae bacterium]|nr:hypothetical protein [Kofleriaceae bacterium]
MSARARLLAVAALALGVLALGLGAEARAYPHFQLSSGSGRCSQCHIGPAGGGLLTPWGQDEQGDTVARGGDGHFLHGAVQLPSWLLVGGNVRLAALANDVGGSEGAELAAFPMQIDLALSAWRGAWSAVAIVGARGVVRSGAPAMAESPGGEASAPSLGSYVISREHYVMWRPKEEGPYARAGRFAAPYGLRLADHTAYVRRYLGGNLLEETYGVGGGWIGDAWELHATAFVSDPLQGAPRREAGGAALLEARPANAIVVGASARAGAGEADTRLQAGVHGKLWIEGARLLLQAEVDGVRQMFAGGAGAGDRWQLAAYAGPVLVPARGLYAGAGYQVFAEDLQVRGVVRQSVDAWLAVFPIAHVEVMASARAQRIGPAEHAYLGMLQLHYAL